MQLNKFSLIVSRAIEIQDCHGLWGGDAGPRFLFPSPLNIAYKESLWEYIAYKTDSSMACYHWAFEICLMERHRLYVV